MKESTGWRYWPLSKPMHCSSLKDGIYIYLKLYAYHRKYSMLLASYTKLDDKYKPKFQP